MKKLFTYLNSKSYTKEDILQFFFKSYKNDVNLLIINGCVLSDLTRIKSVLQNVQKGLPGVIFS